MKKSKKPKRSQIAIFIIIAIVLVVSISTVFIFVGKPIRFLKGIENPQKHIEDCFKPALEQAIAEISKHGGYIDAEISAENSLIYFA